MHDASGEHWALMESTPHRPCLRSFANAGLTSSDVQATDSNDVRTQRGVSLPISQLPECLRLLDPDDLDVVEVASATPHNLA